ncbi:MAG: hypothetical protein ABH857_01080 [Elusimicrobiota bacterium]
MRKRITLCSIFLFVFCFAIAQAETNNKIISCSPDTLPQGSKNTTLTLITNQLLPQKTIDEFLYSSVYFSNPGVQVKEVEFINSLAITCKIDVDDDASLEITNNPVDITIISYDENGTPYSFQGTNMFQVKRRPFIDAITVKTQTGVIKKGETAELLIKGRNILPGEAGVVIVWSGLGIIKGMALDTETVQCVLTKEQTGALNTGRYKICLYNSDGTDCVSEEEIEVID